jgi:hypothetical protein
MLTIFNYPVWSQEFSFLDHCGLLRECGRVIFRNVMKVQKTNIDEIFTVLTTFQIRKQRQIAALNSVVEQLMHLVLSQAEIFQVNFHHLL